MVKAACVCSCAPLFRSSCLPWHCTQVWVGDIICVASSCDHGSPPVHCYILAGKHVRSLYRVHCSSIHKNVGHTACRQRALPACCVFQCTQSSNTRSAIIVDTEPQSLIKRSASISGFWCSATQSVHYSTVQL